MKQAVEEAAKEYSMKNYPYSEHLHLTISTAFEAGAEWQEKQSPWISVEERLPEIDPDSGESEYVLVRYGNLLPHIAKYCTEECHVCPMYKFNGKTYRSHWSRNDFEWIKIPITHWAIIPSYDEII